MISCLVYRTPKEGEILEGNARYEGYAMDLIDQIASYLGFQYRFELVPENAYGSYNKETKKWNGLIKQLLDHVSDWIELNFTNIAIFLLT